MEEERRVSLLSLGWVQALALSLACIVAFGTAIAGVLVWDDWEVLGAASALARPLDAFQSDLFATLPGQGSKYYRPLVTLGYWAEVRVFEGAPNVGMHLSNLVWHAVAAVLLLSLVRRYVGRADDGGPMLPGRAAACFIGVFVWAVMPLKAENVAWITGRGDVMGTVFILAGIETAARLTTARAKAAAMAVGTLLALLCKEPMVAAPAVVAGFALTDVDHRAPGLGLAGHLKRALGRAEVVASLGVVVAYMILRNRLFPISTGGDGAYSEFDLVDRIALFFETSGLAVAALATPWRAQLLRAPIAFEPGGTLRHDVPLMLALGIVVWVGAAILAWRKPTARGPLVLGLGAFLPVSNLVLITLESRLSDRFLYLPSAGVALGIAVMLAAIRDAQRAQIAAAVTGCFGVLLVASARTRAEDFTSTDRLFTTEIKKGNQAVAVYSNAAYAAAESFRFREARDHHLMMAKRYQELNVPGASFSPIFAALRAQVWATEDTHPPSAQSFERLCRAMIAGRAERIELEFDDGLVIPVDTGTPDVRRHAERYAFEVRSSLARVLTRRGDPEGMALTRQNVEGCPTCNAVLTWASEAALAVDEPDRAAAWLDATMQATPSRDALLVGLDAERNLAASGSPYARSLALFVGGAFGPACRAAVETNEILAAPTPVRAAIASACWLAPARAITKKLVEDDADRLAAVGAAAEPLRYDIRARSAMALGALSPDTVR